MRVVFLLVAMVTSAGCYQVHDRSVTDSSTPHDTTVVRDTAPPPDGSCRPGRIIRCGADGLGFRACSPAGNWCRCNDEFDMGTPGSWDGCRGSGVWVCEDLVADAPCYWENHPRCQRNTDCAGSYFTCNADCPAPGPADRCVCASGGSDGWAGCGLDACGVCDTVLAEYPCYFRHHFACTRVDCSAGADPTACDGRLCPPPSEADRGEP